MRPGLSSLATGRVLVAVRLGLDIVPVMVARGWTDERWQKFTGEKAIRKSGQLSPAA